MNDIDLSNFETEMNRGFQQILVLAILETRLYGYLMVKHLESAGYPVEENTLYPLLRRLEKNGLVKSEWELAPDRPKKFYLITERGKIVREKLLGIWADQNKALKAVLKGIVHV